MYEPLTMVVEGGVDCTVDRETPGGAGFGALGLVLRYRRRIHVARETQTSNRWT